MADSPPTVGGLGEDGVLAHFLDVLPQSPAVLLGPGDDAAVLTSVAAPVVTTDVAVEGHHFRRTWCTGADVGWRTAMANLADVAAMGATPIALVVGLVLPPDTEVSWARELALGMAGACRGVGPEGGDVAVVGGDLAAGDQLVVAITAVGGLPAGARPVTRSGAQVGDHVALAGRVGWSAAGLHALSHSGPSPSGPPGGAASLRAQFAPVVEAFLRPTPPLALGPAARLAGASAMMDVSDGLVRDAGRLAHASGVVVDLSTSALGARVAQLSEVAALAGADPLAWVMAGGEDHPLLATFPPAATLPPGFEVIGTVRAGEPEVVVDGAAWTRPSGWDHFGAVPGGSEAD